MSYKIATIAVLLAFAGCSAKNSDPHEQSPAAQEQREYASTVQQTAVSKSELHQPQPKPGAQIFLVDNQVYSVAPGEVTGIDLVLHAPQSQGRMLVTIGVSDGLVIRDGELQHEFTLEPEAVYEIPLQLLALESGRYYVNLQVMIDAEGRQMSRVISAIVQAGSGKDSPTSAEQKIQIESTNDSDALISQPARETIIQ